MLETKDKLLLIPYFWDRALLESLELKASRSFNFYLSRYLEFKNYSIITGFMGYPQIILILSEIKDVFNKEIFFLGTAGAVNNKFNKPIAVNITEIYSSSIFKLFARKRKFYLNHIENNDIIKGTCISVDIPKRENKKWIESARKSKIDTVEMELFPIRVFLKKNFTAIVIITDIVTGNTKINLMNTKVIKKEFVKSFDLFCYIYKFK
jgi:purine-nucleoside phosphorylase